jgi:hypothetical protein
VFRSVESLTREVERWQQRVKHIVRDGLLSGSSGNEEVSVLTKRTRLQSGEEGDPTIESAATDAVMDAAGAENNLNEREEADLVSVAQIDKLVAQSKNLRINLAKEVEALLMVRFSF